MKTDDRVTIDDILHPGLRDAEAEQWRLTGKIASLDIAREAIEKERARVAAMSEEDFQVEKAQRAELRDAAAWSADALGTGAAGWSAALAGKVVDDSKKLDGAEAAGRELELEEIDELNRHAKQAADALADASGLSRDSQVSLFQIIVVNLARKIEIEAEALTATEIGRRDLDTRAPIEARSPLWDALDGRIDRLEAAGRELAAEARLCGGCDELIPADEIGDEDGQGDVHLVKDGYDLAECGPVAEAGPRLIDELCSALDRAMPRDVPAGLPQTIHEIVTRHERLGQLKARLDAVKAKASEDPGQEFFIVSCGSGLEKAWRGALYLSEAEAEVATGKANMQAGDGWAWRVVRYVGSVAETITDEDLRRSFAVDQLPPDDLEKVADDGAMIRAFQRTEEGLEDLRRAEEERVRNEDLNLKLEDAEMREVEHQVELDHQLRADEEVDDWADAEPGEDERPACDERAQILELRRPDQAGGPPPAADGDVLAGEAAPDQDHRAQRCRGGEIVSLPADVGTAGPWKSYETTITRRMLGELLYVIRIDGPIMSRHAAVEVNPYPGEYVSGDMFALLKRWKLIEYRPGAGWEVAS